MKIQISSLIIALLLPFSLSAQEHKIDWETVPVDGSRTGVTALNSGSIDGRKYLAPNGKTFKKGSVKKAAKLMLEAQEEIADSREIIGYSREEMHKKGPESALSDMIIDVVMAHVAKKYNVQVDIGIYNFGGIRADLPKGDIIKDDITSMLPFTNYPVYLVLKGKDIRHWLEYFAAGMMQVIGGVRIVVKDGKLVSAEIGGQAIDDEKEYGLVTLDFLLDGGDSLHLGKNALRTIKDTHLMRDILTDYIKEQSAQGKAIEYKTDGRVTIL